jgi:hypothetical protein
MLLRGARDPIAFWQYAERYLGVGTRSYSAFAGDLEIDREYHPQLGAASFALPTFQVPPERGGGITLPELYRLPGGGFLLPVHPGILPLVDVSGCAPGPALEAVPSANARTVFVTALDGAPVEPHFVKLHYPRRLSRFIRRLRRPVVELQLWVARELVAAGLPVMPEVGGGWLETGWGFLVRTLDTGTGFTVPLFSLYGRDFHRPDDPTVLQQLIDASGEPAASFVSRRLVEPMVRMWVRAALRTGCLLETHGQNTLFRFSASDGFTFTQVAYRDSAVYVDSSLRPGRPLPPTNVIPRDVPMPAEEVRSLTYDSFMGHHALSYVARLVRDLYGVPEQELHAVARAAFADESGGRLRLPASTFYYDDTLYDDGDWKLVDTGRPPPWR